MKNAVVKLLMPATLLLAASCATVPSSPEEPFPQVRRQYDVKVAWETKRTPGNLAVKGTVRNERYPYIGGVELTATVKDEAKRDVGTKTYLFPGDIRMDEESPFELEVPLREGSAPRSIEFTYRYRVRGERMQMPIFHTFEEPL